MGTDRPRLTAGTVSGFSSARIETPASGSITQDFAEGHHALDIGTAMGSPIRGGDGRRRAATGGDGRRRAAGWWMSGSRSGYGLYVTIDHGGGLQTLYVHASAISVRPGETVQAGQVTL